MTGLSSVRLLPRALPWGDFSSARTESPRGCSFSALTTAHQRFDGDYCSFPCTALTPGQTFAVPSTVPTGQAALPSLPSLDRLQFARAVLKGPWEMRPLSPASAGLSPVRPAPSSYWCRHCPAREDITMCFLGLSWRPAVRPALTVH